MLLEEDKDIDHLYRFVRISDDKCCECGKYTTKYFERFKDSLINSSLYFSKPSSFNDPFDCLVDFEENIKEKDFLDYIKRKAKGRLPDDANSVPEGIVIMNNILKTQAKENADKTLGVCCFSKFWDNILLWAHYTDSHHGICIGYKVEISDSVCMKTIDFPTIEKSLPSGIMPLAHVHYDQHLPKPYNPYKGDINELSRFFITKNIKWKYEGEYRAILNRPEKYQRTIHLVEDSIDEITLGIAMSQEMRDEVISFIKSLSKDITIYQTYIKDHTYDISRKVIR